LLYDFFEFCDFLLQIGPLFSCLRIIQLQITQLLLQLRVFLENFQDYMAAIGPGTFRILGDEFLKGDNGFIVVFRWISRIGKP